MRGRVLLPFFLIIVTVVSSLADGLARPMGLSVQNGVLLLEGKPYSGIGVNYFSLGSRILSDSTDTSSLSNLAALANARIPFVRFMCGGYWPSEQQLYLTNREGFFARLDRVIHCAEQNHIGLIPSLFWYLPTVTDLAREPMSALSNTNSRSITLIRSYTRDVVTRYRHSPAIWAWEFGNEASLSADLPNAAEHRPAIVPELGTPAKRTGLDELTSSQLRVAFLEFGTTVRELDPGRLILSGNGLPRASAWHNTHERSWKTDNVDQFREILLRDNSDPMNGISIHVYPPEKLEPALKPLDLLLQASQAAKSCGKPLVVGEFGVSRRAGSLDEQKRQFGDLLAAIREAQVPLAAAWVFDFQAQNDDWNIAFKNDRSVFLKMIVEGNARLQKR